MKFDATLKSYEIFFVHHGVRKRVIHLAPSMGASIAWRVAAAESGVPASVLPSRNVLTLVMDAVQAQGITSVRWNHAFVSSRPRGGG